MRLANATRVEVSLALYGPCTLVLCSLLGSPDRRSIGLLASIVSRGMPGVNR